MRLLKRLTVDDRPFRNKSGLFYSNDVIVEKCLAVTDYPNPLPPTLALYYFALIGQNALVIEIYQYDVTEKD